MVVVVVTVVSVVVVVVVGCRTWWCGGGGRGGTIIFTRVACLAVHVYVSSPVIDIVTSCFAVVALPCDKLVVEERKGGSKVRKKEKKLIPKTSLHRITVGDAKTTTTNICLRTRPMLLPQNDISGFPLRFVHVIHPTLGRKKRVYHIEPAKVIPIRTVASEAPNHDPSNHSHEKGHRHCFLKFPK